MDLSINSIPPPLSFSFLPHLSKTAATQRLDQQPSSTSLIQSHAYLNSLQLISSSIKTLPHLTASLINLLLELRQVYLVSFFSSTSSLPLPVSEAHKSSSTLSRWTGKALRRRPSRASGRSQCRKSVTSSSRMLLKMVCYYFITFIIIR